MGPPGVNDDGSRFPGKSNVYCRHIFFFDLDRSVERWVGRHSKEQSYQRQKKYPHQIGKTGRCAGEQDNESTNSFQNYDSRRLLMLLYQGWYLHKEKETSFLTSCLANFCLTATSLFEIWTPAWRSATSSLLPLLIVPWTKIFPYSIFHIPYLLNKELPRVNSVKCAMWAKYGNNMKIEPQHERLPRKLLQGIRPGPKLWHLSVL